MSDQAKPPESNPFEDFRITTGDGRFTLLVEKHETGGGPFIKTFVYDARPTEPKPDLMQVLARELAGERRITDCLRREKEAWRQRALDAEGRIANALT